MPQQGAQEKCDHHHSLVLSIAGLLVAPSDREYLGGTMRSVIDAVLNVAVFTTLILCIVGFSAWAGKRVPCR
jgi:hypothetical protein